MNPLRQLAPPPLRRLVRRGLDRGAVRWAPAIARGFRPARISAMMRVRNEEAFLAAAVDSIAPLVDEILIIDNASTDGTAAIAAGLARRHGPRVRILAYPHAVARVGSENQNLAESPSGPGSPALLANYYNWCLRRCRHRFILKWDADMVATAALAGELAEFKAGRQALCFMFGANLHPDRRHLLGASAERQGEAQRELGRPVTIGNWTAAFTDPEVRLFPRLGSRYRTGFWWCESFHSPFLRWPALCRPARVPTFLHLKYCKPDPFANFTEEFAAAIRRSLAPGAPLSPELARLAARLPPAGGPAAHPPADPASAP